MQMPVHPQHIHNHFGPNMGMHPGMMHPNMNIPTMIQHDPFNFMPINPGIPMLQSYPYPDLSSQDPCFDLTTLFNPRPRPHRRRTPYQDLYNPSYSYGGSSLGRGSSSRYLNPYDMFDEIFDESDLYLDDYDDTDDPLMLYMRMARSGGGGGRRGGRRGGRYGLGRYGSGRFFD
jgi:hypothetical protein